MANDEASFKQEFRKALEVHYGANLAIWTHTDMMRSGLPDIGASFNGKFYPIEAKFVKKLPERGTSKVLNHELSPIQSAFLRGIKNTGNFPIILVGFRDVAVAVPYKEWPRSEIVRENLAQNLTVDDILRLSTCFRFEKKNGKWDVREFFEKMETHS